MHVIFDLYSSDSLDLVSPSAAVPFDDDLGCQELCPRSVA